jgi:hypothetical protein
MSLTRTPSAVAASIAINTAVSTVVSMADYSGGSVIVPSVWTAANIGFKVCDTGTGTFVPLRDQAGNLVQITNIDEDAATAYPLPDELFTCLYFELWSCTVAGVDTNQGAARSLTVVLKG